MEEGRLLGTSRHSRSLQPPAPVQMPNTADLAVLTVETVHMVEDRKADVSGQDGRGDPEQVRLSAGLELEQGLGVGPPAPNESIGSQAPCLLAKSSACVHCRRSGVAAWEPQISTSLSPFRDTSHASCNL